MTARSPQRLRRSAVQLTSMMDLLFVLLFAFMLKTSGDVEQLAKEATAEVFEELDRVNQEVRQLLFVKDENFFLAKQLELAEQKIRDIEQSQRVSAARIAELEQANAKAINEAFRAPRAGRWKVTFESSDAYHLAEGDFDTFITLTVMSNNVGSGIAEKAKRYVIREEMRGRYGTIYESLSGTYDPETNFFEMTTKGFTHADGAYEVRRRNDPLGYVLLLNSQAQARGWGTFPSNMLGVVSKNGREMRGGSGSHPDPNRQTTSSPWKAVWLSP